MSRAPSGVSYFPAFFDLRGRKVLVAGGDSASAAKAAAFAEAGARVLLVSPFPGPEALGLAPNVKVAHRGWLFGDLMDCFLACAGPRLPLGAVERLASAAAETGAMFYAVDRPGVSDFSSGSAVRRGALSIGISTSGAAPAFGQALRRRIEALIPEGAAAYLPAADQSRAKVKAKFDGASRRRFWADAADAAFDLMQNGDAPKSEKAWEAWLQQRLDGAGADSARLIVIAPPKSVDDVTLGQARALSRTDVAFIAEGAELACLSLLRRDADQRAVKDLSEAQSAAENLGLGQLAVAIVPRP